MSILSRNSDRLAACRKHYCLFQLLGRSKFLRRQIVHFSARYIIIHLLYMFLVCWSGGAVFWDVTACRRVSDFRVSDEHKVKLSNVWGSTRTPIIAMEILGIGCHVFLQLSTS